MELIGKLSQSSVNGLLNNFSSVNFLPLPTLWKFTISEEKCSGETTNQDDHCHGYALFPFSAWTWITAWLKLEPQHLFNASTHLREAGKHGTRHKGTFQLSQSLVNVLYTTVEPSNQDRFSSISDQGKYRKISTSVWVYFEIRHINNTFIVKSKDFKPQEKKR